MNQSFAPIPDFPVSASGLPPEFAMLFPMLSALKNNVDLLTGAFTATGAPNAVTADKISTQTQSGPFGMTSQGLWAITQSDYQAFWVDVYNLTQAVSSLQSQVNSLINNLKS